MRTIFSLPPSLFLNKCACVYGLIIVQHAKDISSYHLFWLVLHMNIPGGHFLTLTEWNFKPSL